MKKRQNKSKVEVVETKSVPNKCDYCRVNGKCGRALSDMFGKLCPGRSCEDWKCEAEGEVEKAGGGGEETPCIHFGGEDYCAEYNAEKITCDKCPKWLAEVEKESAVAVVETSQTFQTSQTSSYRDRVSGHYAAIETAKDNLLRECVKFGALLTEVGYYLGEARHRGNDGDGLKSWLSENCPEVNYNTAMGYKALATKCVKMLGGGSQAVAVLQDKTEVIPPGEDAPVEVESKFLEKRDELFNEVKSRRELEQTYFKFMASSTKGRQGGANKGQPGTGRRALTAVEKAEDAEKRIREIVGSLIAFDQGSNFMKIDHTAQTDIILAIKDIVKSFEEQAG